LLPRSAPAGNHLVIQVVEVKPVDEVEEHDRMVERVAAIDVAKGELKVCVRVPGSAGRRRQEVRTYRSTTRAILEMADWLHGQQVTLGRVWWIISGCGRVWRGAR
jgi:hypothetical protein